FFQAEDGIRDFHVTGVQTCALPICLSRLHDLARKHRVPLEGLAAQRDALAAELEDLAGSAERLAALDGEIAAGAAAWRTAAAARSEERRVGKECESRSDRHVYT